MIPISKSRFTTRLACRVGLGFAGLVVTGSAYAAHIDCNIAKTLAVRAYKRAELAIKDGKPDLAYENKNMFWDLEEFSHDCPAIKRLASTFTSNNLGKDVENRSVNRVFGSSGSSGASGSGGGSGPVYSGNPYPSSTSSSGAANPVSPASPYSGGSLGSGSSSTSGSPGTGSDGTPASLGSGSSGSSGSSEPGSSGR